MDNEKISKPLFNDDVRHSIDNVEERWGREKQRRRKLMLKLSPILLLVIVGCYLGVAKYCHIFPFSLEKQYAEEERLRQEAENKKAPSRTLGFNEAKLQVKLVVEDIYLMNMEWNDVFDELADTKPSEVYIEIWLYKKLPDEDKKLFSPFGASMLINGKSSITYTDEKGVKKTLEICSKKEDLSCNALTMALILNQAYNDTYGKNETIIDIKHFLEDIKQAEEIRKKNALPEVIIPKDTKPAEEAKEVKIDTTGGDPIVLPKLEMKVKE
ncbi:MAG: hypothetical protein IJT83_13640 [Victivallales bacterium]|nr:hypothetical protein [Victivallales bacterium]